MRRLERKKDIIVPESVGRHIEDLYKKSREFRKAYDEEVMKLRIAYKIAQLRKMRHITQRDLAKRAGTTQQNISRLEDSYNTRVSLHTLARLAIALKARLSVDLVPM